MSTLWSSGKPLKATTFLWLVWSSVSNAQSEKPPTFESAVAPVFKAKCFVCHGGPNPQAGLDLQTKQSLLRGGKSGRAIVVGASEKSLLVEKIVSGSMPMGGEKLSDQEIAQIRLWIDKVAPVEDEVPLATLKVSGSEAGSEHDVLPILQMHCTVCHGKRRQEGGLDLRTQAGRLKGGKSGPALVPGKPEESLLMKRILSGEMPPPKMYVEYAVRPPTSSEVEVLRRWIAAGAPTAPKKVATAEDIVDPLVSDADRRFWSFQPPARPAIPKVRHRELVRTPIDAFLLEKLEAKRLAFSPEADRLTLMRRAYLDLIGLPPDRTDVEDYLKDKRVDAYERMIDDLLASRHYGERWGQFWLNAAGYADSEGALDQDMVRPHAWRYRDYVIRSLNKDKPYDQFLLEQIAGDELVNYKNLKEATPEIIDKLAATGFLRMAPDGTYSPGNSSIPERFDVIADEIEIFGSAVLGLTLNCARCHNHKYDPIPQRDYYRFSAILQAAYDPYDWTIPVAVNRYNLRFPSRHLDIALESERREVVTFNAPLEAEIKRLEASLDAQSKPFRERLFEEKVAGLPQSVKEDLKNVLAAPDEKRTELQKYLAEKFQEIVKISSEDLVKRFADFKPEAERIQKAIDDLKKKLRLKPQIRALFDMGDEPSTAYLLRRGEAQTPGEQVQPGVPSVLKAGLTPYMVIPPPSNPQSSGRRLALARWLAQPNHPLTTRVIVNRIWMHHFGRGLVASPANFGRTGVPPSHPELLDWLATEFVQNGWSLKTIHRLVMTSAAYRQTSRIAAGVQRADPDNLLLSRMPLNRMDAEVLYDSILKVTGQLDRVQFGPPEEVETNSEGEVFAKGTKAGWRRSIYVLQRRKTPMTILDVFDLPPMSPNCIERRQSMVTTQALHMMNSDLVKQHARYVAGRLIDEFGEDQAGQIKSLYLRALSRYPTQPEVDDARVAIAELTKHWKVHLENEKHEAPKLPAAQWRALADYCHAILSSPEFLYID
ncbi:MAG: DUF1553 domain-containing protein [Acidobacteria bacterium]|nr:DUF1553 domain-containing protein [Acidobacteriota bacterium]